MRNREIAAELFASVRTVKVRLTSVFRRLKVKSRVQLVPLVNGAGDPTVMLAP